MKQARCPIASQSGASSGRGSKALRQIDRYAGIPLVAIASLLRYKRPVPDCPERIALLNTAAIGDTVLMSAVVADLRDRYREAQLILLAGPSNHEVARLIPNLDAVVLLDIFNPFNAMRQTRRQASDILLDFGPWPRLNAIIAALSGAQYTVGFKTSGQHRHYAYDAAVEHSPFQHELENFRRLVRAIDAEPRNMPSLRSASSLTTAARGRSEGYVIVHMWPGGAGSAHKEWPQYRWQALTEAFVRNGYRVKLTGSRDQSGLNEDLIARLSSSAQASIDNIAGTPLSDLCNELRYAELVVSVNTGLMHMADALGAPLVALHGPTNARRWGPVRATSVSLESPLLGCGYLDLGFEYPHPVPECMNALTFDTVLSACQGLLRQSKSSRGADVKSFTPQ